MTWTGHARAAGTSGADAASGRAARRGRLLTVLTACEVALAVAAVVLDLLLPTLVLLALAAVSLLIRRENVGSLGLRRVPRVGRLVAIVAALSVAWTLLKVAVTMPAMQHLTGQRLDSSQFASLQGNLRLLLAVLALTWTLAAVGEELAYRGFLLTRLRTLLPAGTAGLVAAVALAAVVFGVAHREQGVVGVALVTLDAVFFSVLRYRFATLWAAIVAHGVVDTLGAVGVFLAGPYTGLW